MPNTWKVKPLEGMALSDENGKESEKDLRTRPVKIQYFTQEDSAKDIEKEQSKRSLISSTITFLLELFLVVLLVGLN